LNRLRISNSIIFKRFKKRFVLPEIDDENNNALKKVCEAFSQIPFENLTKIIKSSITITTEHKKRYPEEVMSDYLNYGTGGTCFSLNAAFISVLRYYGFDAHPLLCDRHYGVNTHCAVLLVKESQSYLVDPGYLIYSPIKLPEKLVLTINNGFNELVLEPLLEPNRIELFTIINNQKKLRLIYKTDAVDDGAFFRAWEESFRFDMMRYPVVTYCMDNAHLYLQGNVLRIRKGGNVVKKVLSDLELETFITKQSRIDRKIWEQVKKEGLDG